MTEKKRIYRVLSADDEYWCRENIRNLIPWEDYSMEFLEPAEDGDEVLERIGQEAPDILLTDINMPFMSGLALLERVRKEYPDVITIAISGYDDFDKVKGVFKSGGLDYVLKPVGKEELISVLKKALEILEKREAIRKQGESIRLQEHKMSSFLEDREYSALLTEKLYNKSKTHTHISSTASFSEVAAVLIKFYDINEIAARFDHDIFHISWMIKSRLRELFPADDKTILFHNCNKMSEFLLIGTADPLALSRFSEKIQREFKEEEYGPVSVVIHDQTSSLDDIGTVYREVIAKLVTRPFTRRHCVLHCRKTAGKGRELLNVNVPARLEEELYHLLITGQKSKAEEKIFGTADFRSCGEGGWSFLDVKQYVGRVTGTLFRYVQEYQPGLITYAEEILDSIDYYMKCLDTRSLHSSLQMLLDTLLEVNPRKSTDPASSQVEQIRAFIEKSYFETITLASLADAYHMDASYLSRIFSQKYGETIISFLTRMRMEQAMKLIAAGEQNLETISFLVGYDDYHYFSRVFRKKAGISPREYRSRFFGKRDSDTGK